MGIGKKQGSKWIGETDGTEPQVILESGHAKRFGPGIMRVVLGAHGGELILVALRGKREGRCPLGLAASPRGYLKQEKRAGAFVQRVVRVWAGHE